MVDDDNDLMQGLAHQLELEHQQWLEELARDEAERRFYMRWLDSIYRTETHEPQ